MLEKTLGRLFLLAAVLFPFGIFFIGFGYLPAGWIFTHALMIVLYAALIFLWMAEQISMGAALRFLALTYLVSLTVEAVAMRTGIPFGRYLYTKVLGPAVWGVPAVIPLAWYTTVGSSWALVQWRGRTRTLPAWRSVFFSALLVVALDLVLEPFAALVNRYWLWQGNRIPPVNFLSWFVLAVLIASLAPRPKAGSRLARLHVPVGVFAMQWLLFAFTDLKQGHPVYPALSLAVIVLVFLLAGRKP